MDDGRHVPADAECYDNSVAERFFWSLKHGWTKHDSFADLEAARLSVFKYVETFYNPERLRQTLGYKIPDQFEAEDALVLAAAQHGCPHLGQVFPGATLFVLLASR